MITKPIKIYQLKKKINISNSSHYTDYEFNKNMQNITKT